MPCFGLHPWFVDKARAGWLELLEDLLTRAPSCVGEIGLDHAVEADPVKQEEAFRAQLQLAKKLKRPVSIHCVRAWGRLLAVLKEEQPPSFMLHAYGGPPEMVNSLARLGAYFSFSGGMMNPRREKMRKALLTAPPKRLLFETEFPEPGAPRLSGRVMDNPETGQNFKAGPGVWREAEGAGPEEGGLRGPRSGPGELPEVVRAAALALGQSPESLGESSWRNAKIFLGKFFPVKL